MTTKPSSSADSQREQIGLSRDTKKERKSFLSFPRQLLKGYRKRNFIQSVVQIRQDSNVSLLKYPIIQKLYY